MKEKKVVLQIVKFGGRAFVRCPLVVKPPTTIRRFGYVEKQ
jgi:hypothetical protein